MMIHWCDFCGTRPAEGFFTVIPKGETQPVTLMSCQPCVDDVDEEDWIQNVDLQGGHNAM